MVMSTRMLPKSPAPIPNPLQNTLNRSSRKLFMSIQTGQLGCRIGSEGSRVLRGVPGARVVGVLGWSGVPGAPVVGVLGVVPRESISVGFTVPPA